MGELIKAMMVARAVFDKYAGEEGDKATLTKSELCKLLRAETGMDLSAAEAANFLKILDQDGDSVISYQEYVGIVATFALMLE